MTGDKLSRRTVLIRGVQASLVGAGVLSLGGCGGDQSANACADLDLMDDGEVSMRNSLGYSEKSDNPDQQCTGCTFFTAAGNGSCGSCSIFNGPANPGGRCNSWAAKA